MTSHQYSHHYEELKKLGAGSFAEVMLCLHRPTKTNRAVKIIHKPDLTISNRSPDYLTEFDILRTLDHPSILRCFEVFEDERCYYISTEYCPAGDLFSEVVKFKKFSEFQVADVMHELLSALVYCHEKGVIHRDLKPENILLLEKGENFSIKVADFGSSVLLNKNRKISGCYGSAYYLAPEIFSDTYDEKCDIWSAGIIMYILLTGKPPYPGRDSETIIQYLRSQPFLLTPAKTQLMSSHAADLLKQLLVINPSKRITAKQAMKHPWIKSRLERIPTDIEQALNDLKTFNCQSKLQEAVRVFITSQITSHEDIKYFKKSFQIIDKDGNGKITKEELVAQYSKFMSLDEACKVAKEIIEKIDQDEDGMIDYTEFLVSCTERQLVVSLDYLEAAFKAFDLDDSGTITVEEIKNLLGDGEQYDENIWKTILEEADDNNDGCIDLKEFISLMNNFKSNFGRVLTGRSE
jgi:calcium-dependent protein kinase